jgi:hypothetical protein
MRAIELGRLLRAGLAPKYRSLRSALRYNCTVLEVSLAYHTAEWAKLNKVLTGSALSICFILINGPLLCPYQCMRA